MFGDWVRGSGCGFLREIDVARDWVMAWLRKGVMHVWEKYDEMQGENQMGIKHNQKNQR